MCTCIQLGITRQLNKRHVATVHERTSWTDLLKHLLREQKACDAEARYRNSTNTYGRRPHRRRPQRRLRLRVCLHLLAAADARRDASRHRRATAAEKYNTRDGGSRLAVPAGVVLAGAVTARWQRAVRFST